MSLEETLGGLLAVVGITALEVFLIAGVIGLIIFLVQVAKD
jgi:type III secretory pathway component EscS